MDDRAQALLGARRERIAHPLVRVAQDGGNPRDAGEHVAIGDARAVVVRERGVDDRRERSRRSELAQRHARERIEADAQQLVAVRAWVRP